jgi:hypothetical protein
MRVELTEEDRQVLVLALARLGRVRPILEDLLAVLAVKLHGELLYREVKDGLAPTEKEAEHA